MGFPIKISQSLFKDWPATDKAQSQLEKLVVPTDFSVNWQNKGIQTGASISVRQSLGADGKPGVFQISGYSTDGSTLTYGNATYNCSGIISIVQNQHPNLYQGKNALYEIILAFQITNKSTNPSSPDVILLCRPLIFVQGGYSPPFWNAVDTACVQKKAQKADIDLSELYGYNSSLLFPMVTYQTCLPVKAFTGSTYSYGSLRVRVNVVMHPLMVVATENGLGKCSSINRYTMVTTGNGPIDLFQRATAFQFRDGYGTDLFPSRPDNQMVPNYSPTTISEFPTILNIFEIQVPKEFLGKSLSEIANAKVPEKVKPKKKAFKCYTIDPTKDIVGDQIMVDPTTGKKLKDTLNQGSSYEDDDGTPETVEEKYYTLSGPAINGTIKVTKVVDWPWGGQPPGTNIYLAQDGPLVRGVISTLPDFVNQSVINYKGKVDDFAGIATFQKEAIKYDKNTAVIVTEVKTSSVSINNPGILPGDIEYAITVVIVIIGTLSLIAYMGFIAYNIFHLKSPLNEYFHHIILFFSLFICLILFGIFVEKPLEESRS